MATSVTCASCNTSYEARDADGIRDPCPRCGYNGRQLDAVLEVGVKFWDGTRVAGFAGGMSRAKGKMWELISGHAFSVGLGRMIKKFRLLDFKNNEYAERIEDPETGEIFHDVAQPLRDHQGHGYAKLKRPDATEQDEGTAAKDGSTSGVTHPLRNPEK